MSITDCCVEHDIAYQEVGGTEEDRQYADGRLFKRVYEKLKKNLDIGTPEENEFRAMVIASTIHEAVRLFGKSRFSYHG